MADPVFTDGVVPWNSLDDTMRLPTASELQNGYLCGPLDLKLFNFTTAYAWGQVENAIIDAGLTVDRTDLTQLRQAISALVVSAFTASRSFTVAGWQVFPGGLIIQWLQGAVSANPTDFTLPIAFPNAHLHAFVTETGAGLIRFGADPVSLTQVRAWTSDNAFGNGRFLCLGY
ncbi:hypothetical protein JET14_13195 [Martelella lutilitoris]|uniref:Putative tail fiber protein gp53-like C-terminal domain-containing protein n=1 Tax=Martelella lutilitoris TaxID=2583532 RepID=A0A7T7KK80_9HYPH|nr:hypothetical protein [Martelella lutilitoris]QQM29283.1 hypothetical protein JET14_13195 [Martelella lutilitoris]